MGCLSWRHSAALMGFPRDWNFPRTSRAAQRAVGNAIPPPLAKAMMEAAIKSHGEMMPSPILQEALDAVEVDTALPEPPLLALIKRIEADLSLLKSLI